MPAWVAAAVLLLAHLLPGVALGDAEAAKIKLGNRQLAWEACVADAASHEPSGSHQPICTSLSNGCNPGVGEGCYAACLGNGTSETSSCWVSAWNYYLYNKANDGCPSGSTWIQDVHVCFNSQECLAKPPLEGYTYFGSTITESIVWEGCEFIPDDPTGISGFCSGPAEGESEPLCISATRWKPSGNPPTSSTAAPSAVPTTNGQTCIPAGDNMTFCLKADGSHCATASTGRQICWRPGETGEKPDGDTLQVRNAGAAATPPTTPPPPGDTFQQAGPSKTTTTSVAGVSITTTFTNYKTSSGSNAGGGAPDQGENEDGTPGKTPGNSGEGDGKGSASGGGDCDTPPIVSGDAVLAMVATQTWATRCAVEAGNAAKVTGDVADCSQPFTVEGNNANAVKLRAMRAQICKDDANGDGQPDWTEGDAPVDEEEPGDEPAPPSELTVGTNLLDMSGIIGGSATCPELGVLDFGPFGEFDMDGEVAWCQLVQVMRAVVLLFAALAAVRILMGGK